MGGERFQESEQPAYEQAAEHNDHEQIEKQAILEEYAATSMAYTTADGVTHRVNGSAEVVELCPPIREGVVPAVIMRFAFEAAALLEAELKANEEKKPDEENEEDESKVDVPEDDKPVPPEPVVEQRQKIDQQPASEPIAEVTTPEPVVEVAASNVAAQPQPDSPIDPIPEQETAPLESVSALQNESNPSLPVESAVVTESIADKKAPTPINTPEIGVKNETSEPIIEQAVDSVVGSHRVIDLTYDRDERVAEATQAVMDVIEAQATVDESQTAVEAIPVVKEQLLDEQLPAPHKELLPPIEVLETLADVYDDDQPSETEQVVLIPIVEATTGYETQDVVFEDIYGDDEWLSKEAVDTDEQPAVEPETHDDVTEHVMTLTAILEAEHAAADPESNDESVAGGNDIGETYGLSGAGEFDAAKPAAEITPNNEMIQINGEMKQILEAITIVAPESVVTIDVTELSGYVDEVIQKIDTLQAAVSAEECREAVEDIRVELTSLLMAIGLRDASSEAGRLLKHWQYDMESLKRYMVSLKKAIVAAQGAKQVAKQANSVTELYKHYGARAVHMAVSFTKQPLHVRRAAA